MSTKLRLCLIVDARVERMNGGDHECQPEWHSSWIVVVMITACSTFYQKYFLFQQNLCFRKAGGSSVAYLQYLLFFIVVVSQSKLSSGFPAGCGSE